MQELNDISARIKALVDQYAEGNVSKFALIVGTSEVNVRNYINGTQPKYDFLNKVANNLDVNCEWLLMGKTRKQVANDLSLEESKIINQVQIDFQAQRIADLEARLKDKEQSFELMQINIELKEEILNGYKKANLLMDELLNNEKNRNS